MVNNDECFGLFCTIWKQQFGCNFARVSVLISMILHKYLFYPAWLWINYQKLDNYSDKPTEAMHSKNNHTLCCIKFCKIKDHSRQRDWWVTYITLLISTLSRMAFQNYFNIEGEGGRWLTNSHLDYPGCIMLSWSTWKDKKKSGNQILGGNCQETYFHKYSIFLFKLISLNHAIYCYFVSTKKDFLKILQEFNILY